MESSKNNYDWPQINQRYMDILRCNQNATALKFILSEEELNQIPNKTFPGLTMACEMIGLTGYYDKTYIIRTTDMPFDYCCINNGLRRKTERWKSGIDLASPPLQWFKTQEESKKHSDALSDGIPKDLLYAIAASPIKTNDIKEPDVISIVLQPGAAFYFLSGLIENNFRKIQFPFIGESSCIDTWGYTFNTGLPGLSFGCRGDRCLGAMGNDEVRLTVTPDDFVTAVNGMYRLYEGGVTYPFYPRWSENIFK